MEYIIDVHCINTPLSSGNVTDNMYRCPIDTPLQSGNVTDTMYRCHINTPLSSGNVVIIIIKTSDASPSGKNRTFTKLQSNPTSTCATEKKKTDANELKQTKINCSLKTTQRTRVKHRGREIIPHANMRRQKTSSKLGRPTPRDLKLTKLSHSRSTSMSYPLTGGSSSPYKQCFGLL